MYGFVRNSPVNQTDKLGLELVIIRVASSEELLHGTDQSNKLDQEVKSWNEIFKKGEESLDAFIAGVEAITDKDWKTDKWGWAFNKGISPDNHYLIKGDNKEKIIQIAQGEKKSRIVTIKSGNGNDVEAKIREVAQSLGEFGRIALSLHGEGTQCHFPDGSKAETQGSVKSFTDAAAGKPLFIVSCGQQLAFERKLAGGLATQIVSYSETLMLGAQVRFNIDAPKCRARLGSYRVQREYKLPGESAKDAPEGFVGRNPDSFEY